jgi:hypothetical protein
MDGDVSGLEAKIEVMLVIFAILALVFALAFEGLRRL